MTNNKDIIALFEGAGILTPLDPNATQKHPPPKPDPNRTTEESDLADIVHEGLVSDLLVKMKIIDPKSFIDSIFKAVEKKTKGIDKKARVDTDGNKVINIAAAIGYVGKKGGEVDLAEIGNSVEDLKRATTAFVQKYEMLTTAITQNANKYIPLDTAKQALVMAMAVGQVADLVRALNSKVEDTAKNVDIESKDAPEAKTKKEKEEEPAGDIKEPAKVQAAAKQADSQKTTVEPKEVQKILDTEQQEMIDKADKKVKARKPRAKKEPKYEDAYTEIAHAIDLIQMFTNYSLEQAQQLTDEILALNVVNLNKRETITGDLFYRAIAAVSQSNPNDIKDDGLRTALKNNLQDLMKAENKKNTDNLNMVLCEVHDLLF